MSGSRRRDLGRIVALVEGEARFGPDRRFADLARQVADGMRRTRLARGLTREQAADALGLAPQRLARIESGLIDHAPDLETIAKFADLCGVSVELAFTAAAPFAGPIAEPEPASPVRQPGGSARR